jgi:hypothetical protein
MAPSSLSVAVIPIHSEALLSFAAMLQCRLWKQRDKKRRNRIVDLCVKYYLFLDVCDKMKDFGKEKMTSQG